MSDQEQQPTSTEDATTEESGTESEGQGNADPTVAGLSKRLNKEIEERKQAKAKLDELTPKAARAEELERENKILKLEIENPAEGATIRKLVEKGTPVDAIDEEFIASLRAKTSNQVEDFSNPAHNTVRRTQPSDPDAALRAMTWD